MATLDDNYLSTLLESKIKMRKMRKLRPKSDFMVSGRWYTWKFLRQRIKAGIAFILSVGDFKDWLRYPVYLQAFTADLKEAGIQISMYDKRRVLVNEGQIKTFDLISHFRTDVKGNISAWKKAFYATKASQNGFDGFNVMCFLGSQLKSYKVGSTPARL